MSENSMDQDDGWLSKEVCDAMTGDRHTSIKMWKQVAKGDFNLEVRLWLEHTAEAVLEAEGAPANRLRDAAIVSAIGLSGGIDMHRGFRAFVTTLKEFGQSRKQIIRAARTGRPPSGIELFIDYDPNPYANYDEKVFVDMIDRVLKNYKPS
jgi:hypothetical protein